MPLGDPLADRIEQPELDRQLADRGRLAARDHQRVDVVQLLRPAYAARHHVGLGQRAQVLADVTLQGQHSDDGISVHAVHPR